jgi:hypothetical protein
LPCGVGQIKGIFPRVPCPWIEGRFAIVTERWARDAMDASTRKTNALEADGEVVWSWPLDAEVKLADDLPTMVATKPDHQGDHEVSCKTIAQGMPDCSAYL